MESKCVESGYLHTELTTMKEGNGAPTFDRIFMLLRLQTVNLY